MIGRPGIGAVARPVLALTKELAVRLPQQRSHLAFLVRASGVDVLHAEQQGRLLFSAQGAPPDAVREAVTHLGGQRGHRLAAIVLAPDQTLSKTLRLPAGSGDVVAAIMRNKVESVAPWPLAQSVWGYRVQPLAKDAAHLSVDLVVASCSRLAELAKALEDAGLTLAGIDAQLPTGETVRLPFGGEHREKQVRHIAAAGLIGATVLAGIPALLGCLLVIQAYAGLARLTQQTEQLMDTLHMQGADDQGTGLVAEANRLYRKRLERIPAVAVLDDLSKQLPDTAWLTAVSIDHDKVEMQGRGTSVPSLVSELEKSPTLADVNFAAATEHNATSGADEFSLTARLEASNRGGAQP